MRRIAAKALKWEKFQWIMDDQKKILVV